MVGDKILLMFSRKLDKSIYDKPKLKYTIEESLNVLTSAFGLNFLDDISRKKILDFGCGFGYQVVAMALKGADFVVGVDIREKAILGGIDLAKIHGVYEKVQFLKEIKNNYQEYFDLIISQNSFEHYPDPDSILKLWWNVLKYKGKVYLTFGPPWYAPYGAHTYFFTKIPWTNIFFRETKVMKVRSYFISDGAKRYEEVEGGLNKMTVRRFEKIIRNSRFTIKYINYHAVKKIKIMTKIPVIREFFINQIDCILIKE